MAQSLESLIREKLEAHYAVSSHARDLSWLVHKWEKDHRADWRAGKLHSRSYWTDFS